MVRRILVIAALLWISNLCQTHAGLITYTESVVATGTIGSQSFSDALVTLTLTADTSGITESSGVFSTSAAMATVNIASIGNATFTNDLVFFNEPGASEAGFEDFSAVGGSAVVLAIFSASLDTYELASPIGPITGDAHNGGGSFATTLGTLFLQQPENSGTFTATIQSVPEPTSIAMLGTGILTLAGLRLSKRKIT
jgi:hypothetical protein